MIERAGKPSGPPAARVQGAPIEEARRTERTEPDRGALRGPDAPAGGTEGVYHQRKLEGAGPSGLVSVRLAEPAAAFRSEGATRFARALDAVRRPGPNRVGHANVALDTLLNYLDQRTDHANQTGSMHAELHGAPPEERVPLLRRAIHILRKAVRDGVLPPDNMADLQRLARVSQGMGWNFDLDDNIASLATKIVIFDKATGEERALSTTEFAEVREKIGQPGALESFEIRTGDGPDNSFRNFRDVEDPGVFWRDLSAAMTSDNWRGPSWAAFQRAMSFPETAKWSTIITARGHYPNTIHAALRRLVDQGHLEHVMPRENIFPVSLPGLAVGGDASSPSAAKVRVMESYLDRLQAAPFGPSAQPVVPPDGGRGRRYMHLWGFSDDDHGTFKKTLDELGSHVKAGRWPDVKITVFFTGSLPEQAEEEQSDGTTARKLGETGHDRQQPARVVVIKPDGSVRPRLASEEREVDHVLEGIARAAQLSS